MRAVMRSRLSDDPSRSAIGGLMLLLAAASLPGCASTQTASPASSPGTAALIEKTAAFLRVGHGSSALSGSDPDTIIALAIAAHEMRRP